MADYIRRVKPSWFHNGKLTADAFLCGEDEPDLSVTLAGDSVEAFDVEAYWRAPWTDSRTRPALCVISSEDIRQAGLPEPTSSPQEEPFGDAHCSLEKPSPAQASELARRARPLKPQLRPRKDGTFPDDP